MGFELHVPPEMRRSAVKEEEWLDSARWLLELTCERLGHDSLADLRVLDVGCGTKLTKALLEDERPIGRYVGVDVDPDVIALLHDQVHDERFEFHHMDVHNAMYNPTGLPLAERERLPVGDEQFDVIILFSVFTHLAPHDYPEMLRLLRAHAAPDGGLLYSLYLRETDETVADTVARRLGNAMTERPVARKRFAERFRARIEAGDEQALAQLARRQAERRARIEAGADTDAAAREVPPAPSTAPPADRDGPRAAEVAEPDFVDLYPEEPLRVAIYARPYALDLVDGTGWEVTSVHPPDRYVQHQIVCRPV